MISHQVEEFPHNDSQFYVLESLRSEMKTGVWIKIWILKGTDIWGNGVLTHSSKADATSMFV